jgi:hypothetical protein
MSLWEKLMNFGKPEDKQENIKVDYDYDSGRWLYKDSIIGYINDELQRRKQEKLPLELIWQLISNFLSGNQYCDINLATMQIEDLEKPFEWMEREVFNRMAPIYETRQAKLSRVRTGMIVKPGSNELKDIARAKTSTSILKGSQAKLKYFDAQSTANAWMDMLGTVFWVNWWNTQGGRRVFEEEILIHCEDGENRKETKAVFEGDLGNGILTPFEVYPDSIFNQELEDCQSIIIEQIKSADYIYNLYGVRVPGRTIRTYSLTPTVNTGGLGYLSFINTLGIQEKTGCEYVKTYMELPSRDFPEGKMAIVVADSHLVYYGPLPYKVGEDQKRSYPLVKQVCIKKPGSFFGTTVYERMIPVQRAYNAVKNRKHDYLNRVAIQSYTYDEGAVDIERLQDEGVGPGSLIPKTPGKDGLKPIENGNLPTEFRDEEYKLQRELEYLSGISEMSVISSTPGGVDSGIAIESIKESDDTRLALTAENIRNAAIENSKQWLRIYKQFTVGPRILQFTGNNSIANVLVWDSSDIGSYDIVLETENELLDTPVQRRQTTLLAMNQGLFNNEDGYIDKRTKAKLYKALNLGTYEEFLDIEQLQIDRAQRENTYLEFGIIPEVADYDDHQIHIEEHNRLRLSTDYEVMKVNKPEICRILDTHVKQHEQRLAMMAQQMQAMTDTQQPQQETSNGPAKTPATSIQFKDLPAEGKVQLAAQAGINISAEQATNMSALPPMQ